MTITPNEHSCCPGCGTTTGSDYRITAQYGSWAARVNHAGMTVEQGITDALDDWNPSEETLDAVCAAYRGAINAALPDSVVLCGNEFYGPAVPEDGEFADYPADEDGRLDLNTIVALVDFWELAEPILDPLRPTPKLDELLSRTSPFSETDGTTLIAAPGHWGENATPSPAHELVRWVMQRYELNGSDRAVVRALTGLTDAELDELGGFSDDRG